MKIGDTLKESIRIEGGLGPIQALEPIELDILPLTVFIGPQGTGKSLISQLLYFFRDAEYLLARYSGQKGPETEVGKIVDGVRAGDLTTRNALASFLTTSPVRISYERENEKNTNGKKLERTISISQKPGKITPVQPFTKEVENWLQSWVSDLSLSGRVSPNALFVPAERSFYSRFINSDPKILGTKGLPLTMREFARALGEAADTYQLWQEQPEQRPKKAKDIENLVMDTLGGQATSARKGPYARRWQWLPKDSSRPIELEMASSGQMEAWPLVFTAQAVFGRERERWPIFWHIEEPETHLHPRAQVAIVKLLTYLVNQGFHIIITTHSLVVAYVLNNLTLAYRQLGDKEAERVPEVQVRLDPAKIMAYLFIDGKIEKVVDELGQIDEGLLGQVLGDLQVEFNRLMTYKSLWE
jgi:hypothetical protein